MCGIVGFLSRKEAHGREELLALVTSMAKALRHRGPDGAGQWVDERRGIAFGHRRLSIIDLSDAGSQPQTSASGRYVITYNGEIYNFRALRAELDQAGYPFRGHSDTEVLVAAIERWGLDTALSRIEGMFAFALWDREQDELTLVRDRAGEKPLYYGWCNGSFLFGSEIKALKRHPGFDDSLDRDVVALFVRYGWIPDPLCVYAHLRKLPPGSLLRVRPDSAAWSVVPKAYWSAKATVERAQSRPFGGDYRDALDHLDALLRQAVKQRMVADVELGAFLSGGIDSSLVVAHMQAEAERPAKTFSIGYWEEKFDESGFARAVSEHLGTDHRQLVVTPKHCLDVIEQLTTIYDEPFADVSQVPTYLVSRFARQHVKVTLSGDGGDELFAGYKHYQDCLQIWQRASLLPLRVRQTLTSAANWTADRAWQTVEPRGSRGAEESAHWLRATAKLSRRMRGWTATSPQELMSSRWARVSTASQLVPDAQPLASPLNDPASWATVTDPLPAMLQFDYASYLPGDILVKVDRASMAASLEVRCPLLDSRVVEFAWSLPRSALIDHRGGKRILKDLLARYVPEQMIDRPKRGFGVPIGEWLRGPLRRWAEDLIDESRLHREAILAPRAVSTVWQQHKSRWCNHENLLWAVLMFQAWHEAEQGSTGQVAEVSSCGPKVETPAVM